MKTKAIGYVRVSTDKQADRGVSLEAQVEKIRAMATVHDVELLDVLVDAGESAKDLDRPGMVRILELVQSRAVGMVIIAKLDRRVRPKWGAENGGAVYASPIRPFPTSGLARLSAPRACDGGPDSEESGRP